MADFTRRDVLKIGAASGAFALAGSFELFAEGALPPPDVWVLKGKSKSALMAKALEIIQSAGGFGSNVKKMALKVNAAFARAPETGACTHPELVKAFLEGTRAFGVKNVVVPEFPCDPASEAFVKSGVYAAVEAAGFSLFEIKRSSRNFVPTEIKTGKAISAADIYNDFLDSDVVVNMPVCKSHSGAGMSLGMKNWMGAVKERRAWHDNNLHQCIADIATVIKPHWTLIDATRVMLTGGPKGPSDNVLQADALIVSKDFVAADAWAANKFWGKNAARAKYIALAAAFGLGVDDVSKMNVKEIEV